jgi:gas vesicle protein
MHNETQERKNHSSNIGGIFAGLLLGGLAGAVAALLLAPQSGKVTRTQIKEKGLELRDRTTEFAEDTMAQVRSSADRLTGNGREKIAEQLDRVSDAVQAGKRAIQSPSAG